MDLMLEFINKAKASPRRIVYPEGHDERLIATAVRVKELGIAVPTVLGSPDDVKAATEKAGVSLDGVTVIDPKEDRRLDEFAENYAAARDMKVAIAKKLVRKPLAFGGMMVKTGNADGMVGGADNTTSAVIQAASLTIGLRKGISTPTSYFIMIVPEFQGQKDKIFIFADSAVNIQPDAKQLAATGVVCGQDARNLLGLEPKVAFLSCSTKGSAAHADIDKVVEAVRIAREMNPGFDVDGEFQVDAAIVPRVAKKKVKESPVAGQANVLIFPDLDAGNIAYKIVQYTANALALGPVLVGFNKPVNDLSRGAVVEDIVGMTAITVVQAQNVK